MEIPVSPVLQMLCPDAEAFGIGFMTTLLITDPAEEHTPLMTIV
jgi:hypothetical protein